MESNLQISEDNSVAYHLAIKLYAAIANFFYSLSFLPPLLFWLLLYLAVRVYCCNDGNASTIEEPKHEEALLCPAAIFGQHQDKLKLQPAKDKGPCWHAIAIAMQFFLLAHWDGDAWSLLPPMSVVQTHEIEVYLKSRSVRTFRKRPVMFGFKRDMNSVLLCPFESRLWCYTPSWLWPQWLAST